MAAALEPERIISNRVFLVAGEKRLFAVEVALAQSRGVKRTIHRGIFARLPQYIYLSDGGPLRCTIAKKVTLRESPAEMNLGTDFIVTAVRPCQADKYAML